MLQKGVHLILNAVHELMHTYQGKIQIICGGMANMTGMNRNRYVVANRKLCPLLIRSFV